MKSSQWNPDGQRAWISNIAFPTSAEELLNVLRSGDGLYDTEVILNEHCNVRWTVPTWAHKGDIVFFMHSVSAINKIRRLRKEIRKNAANYSCEDMEIMERGIERAEEVYRCCGGKLIGTAQLASDPIRGYTESFRHWKGSIYATIEQTKAFAVPIDREGFKEKITISRTGGVTQIYEDSFRFLCDLIAEKNELPEYLLSADLYRGRIYATEDEFRAVCVDPILHAISPVVYRECRCRKAGVPDSFADNVILISGKYIPVEVKLNFSREAICDQLWKYCNNDTIDTGKDGQVLTREYTWHACALLVEPEGVSIYDARVNRLKALTRMKDIHNDPFDLRDAVEAYLAEDDLTTK